VSSAPLWFKKTIFAERFEADYGDFFTTNTSSGYKHLAEAINFVFLIENIINNSPYND
jgi:hypothetical protein